MFQELQDFLDRLFRRRRNREAMGTFGDFRGKSDWREVERRERLRQVEPPWLWHRCDLLNDKWVRTPFGKV